MARGHHWRLMEGALSAESTPDHPDNAALVPLKPVIRRSPQYHGRLGQQTSDIGSVSGSGPAMSRPGVGDQLAFDIEVDCGQ